MKLMVFFTSVIFSYTLCAEGLVSGTLLKTVHGYVSVDKVDVGYKILSTNLSGVLSEATVVQIFKQSVPSVIRIIVDSEIIEVAPSQRFYLALAKRWIRADQLTKNSLLLNAQGQVVRVIAVKEIARTTDVVTIIVNNNHNFFISLHDILVHNAPKVINLA